MTISRIGSAKPEGKKMPNAFRDDVKALIEHIDTRELGASQPILRTLVDNVKRHLKGVR